MQAASRNIEEQLSLSKLDVEEKSAKISQLESQVTSLSEDKSVRIYFVSK